MMEQLREISCQYVNFILLKLTKYYQSQTGHGRRNDLLKILYLEFGEYQRLVHAVSSS